MTDGGSDQHDCGGGDEKWSGLCVLGLGGPPVSLPTQLKDSLGDSPVADTEPSTLFYMLI